MSDGADDSSPVGGTLPRRARDGPYEVRVEDGQSYRWCRCGLSATQPWCDGSHEGTGLEPIEFVAPLSGTFFMCGCKGSDNPPFCFGNCRGHRRMRGDGPAI